MTKVIQTRIESRKDENAWKAHIFSSKKKLQKHFGNELKWFSWDGNCWLESSNTFHRVAIVSLPIGLWGFLTPDF